MSGPRGYLTPIFIGGCDRSGTTLLGATLARFPGVVALPESQFIFHTAYLHTEHKTPLPELAKYIAEHRRFAAWRDIGCANPQAHLTKKEDYRGFLDALIIDYARASGVEAASIFVDHSPDNRANIRILRRVYPDMKFVHMIRDGRGVAASLIAQDWGPNDILEAAQVWQKNVAAGFASCDYLGDAAQSLRFEALVEEEDETLETVATLAGTPSFSAAKETTSYMLPAYAGPTHALVKEKPSRDRIESWRQKLSERQIELFEHYAGALLDALGYERVFPRGAARKASLVEKAGIMIRRWISYRRNNRRMQERFSS